MLVLVSLPTYGFLFGDQTTLLERIGYIGVFDDLLIVRALSIISISHAGYVLGILLGTQKLQTQIVIRLHSLPKKVKSSKLFGKYFRLLGSLVLFLRHFRLLPLNREAIPGKVFQFYYYMAG